MIFGLHAIAATPMVNAPEFALTQAESAELAKAVDRLDLFSGNSTIPAWAVPYVGLAAVAGKLYVPRVMAYKARTTAEKARGVNGPAPVNTAGPTVQGTAAPPPRRPGKVNGEATPMDMNDALRAAMNGSFGVPQGNA